MSLATVSPQRDPSPPVPSRAFWSFWAFSFVGAPILAVLGLYAFLWLEEYAVVIVAALAIGLFWLIERRTPITAPMAVGGFVVAAVATIAWGYLAIVVLVLTGVWSFD